MEWNQTLRRCAAALALLLAVSACGGGDDAGGGDGEAALVEALGAEIWTQMQSDEELPEELDKEAATCVAQVIVDVVGYDELEEAGVTVEALESGGLDDVPNQFDELSVEQAGELADGTLGCVDFESVVARQFAADDTISEGSARCLADGMLQSEGFRDLIVQGIVGGEDAFAAATQDSALAGMVFQLMADCLTPEELSSLMGGAAESFDEIGSAIAP